ncbi:MAG: SAM-dependent methyltransferase [Parachlamydiaceae bacterium]|nr:SAM-dependent methyltransferase [Parachlamydiaceae bacterium]
MYNWIVIAFFLALILFILVSIILWSLRNGISPMPTSHKAKCCLLSVLPKMVNGKVYELGSGWGTLLFPIARHYPGRQIVGYETSLLPYWFSRMRRKLGGYPNVEILRKDFFEVAMGDAGLVVCYLYPGAMRRLKDKLRVELPPDAWVVSNTFSVPGWPASRVCEVGDIYYSKVYVYRLNSL